MCSTCGIIHALSHQCCVGSVGFYDLCDRCRRLYIESDTEPDTPEKKPMPPGKKRRPAHTGDTDTDADRDPETDPGTDL